MSVFTNSLARLISTHDDLRRTAMQIGQRVATSGKLRQFHIKKPVHHRPFRYSDVNESVTCVAEAPFRIQVLISVFDDHTFRYSLYQQRGHSIDPSPSETRRIEDGGQQFYDLDDHDITQMIDDLSVRLTELTIAIEEEEAAEAEEMLVKSGCENCAKVMANQNQSKSAKFEDFLELTKGLKLNAIDSGIKAVIKRINTKRRSLIIADVDSDIPTINALTNLVVFLDSVAKQLGDDGLRALWVKGPIIG